ncbi:Catechol 2,3-dioxygenase [Pseudonocardia ammonioxydans]|uniref:Catechol 2,3-dioxygenase n=1 Tax=Pseudonocardia ammonioxydans TaxID=260086 RepID=A0A1I4XVU5_PSUAM|nr:VOC family protein [Pseudonocardia ammonioxydans]SFN30021.1 Catechol 2,3-dioxygenase [Pseudonocardia ammonioxydans]
MSTPPPSASATRVSKLVYLGFDTPDVARMVDYYTNVLDLELIEKDHNRAFLTTNFDHHCVVLTKGGPKARAVVGYEVHEELGDAQRRLQDAGYDVERRSDIGPGTPDVLVLTEPDTSVPLHLVPDQDPSGVEGYSPLRPTKLGHVAAFAPSLEPLESFYKDLLGFRWSDTIGDFFVFLRCNADHHAANFMASTKYEGMHHVAYEMRDPAHLISMLDHLAKHDYRLHWGPAVMARDTTCSPTTGTRTATRSSCSPSST